ncbi:OmpA family protein [Ornithinimicrobium sp. Y1694]|uniref:OmpA family protein n=1 Tax=Ornithinimicrobium sp. Y1694 TaxID=3418590 RepID=UPI003CEE87D2
MRRRTTAVLTAVATAAALAACTPDGEPGEESTQQTEVAPAPETDASDADAPETAAADDEAATDPGEVEQTTEPEIELNTFQPIETGVERVWPEEIGSLSDGDNEFTLFGVHRLDEERVVVTGKVAAAASTTIAASWFEPGFFRPRGGYEFSRVALVGADEVRHLPVRDADDRCLCSVSTDAYPELEGTGEAPAWVVIALPQDQPTVDVELPDLGTFEDVPVTELPDSNDVPFGWTEVLTIDQATREDGVVSALTTIANPGDFQPTYLLSQHRFSFPELEGQHCFQGLAAYGGSTSTGRMVQDEDCHRGSLPQAGEQITLDVLVADPGGPRLVLLPDAGLPVVMEATGEAAEGPSESLRTYAARSEQAGATVEEGEELMVSLDTEVLFAFDEATLTADADETIAAAVAPLDGQPKRSIVVAGHTDGQGSAERNEVLSQERAEAVAAALEAELGDGWDIAVEWHGPSQPLVEETGTPEQVEAAQARNRRVEVLVP